MGSLDRSLTQSLIANFKDPQAVLTAVLRLKGQELRLATRIKSRERAGGPLQSNLAAEDRARLKIVRKMLDKLQTIVRASIAP